MTKRLNIPQAHSGYKANERPVRFYLDESLDSRIYGNRGKSRTVQDLPDAFKMGSIIVSSRSR